MKNWIIAVSTDAWDIIPNAEHIERNDELVNQLPEDYDDFSAAQAAMKKGIKLISDIGGIYKNFYVDTPENRAIINAYIQEHPEELNRELIGIKAE